MARVQWNNIGTRLFEAGVDRGVLYVDGQDGVPWNGLVAVSESPSGGDVTSYYIDGIKYLNHVAGEDFEATIEAFTYPDEFRECEGSSLVKNGLFATQQAKKSFGLAYRTMIGNDLEGVDYAYKLHLVYNAIAEPTSRPNSTVGESLEPFNFSWAISARPDNVAGIKPTSHFVIDSRETPENLLEAVENILYGSEVTESRLPSADELMSIFNEFESGVYDAGLLVEPYYLVLDGGLLSETQTETVDAGGP